MKSLTLYTWLASHWYQGLLLGVPKTVSAPGWSSLGPTASSHRGNAPAHCLFYAIQLLSVFLVLSSPKWNAMLQMWCSEHWEEGIILSLVFWLWVCSHHQGCCWSSLLPGHTGGWYLGPLPASAPRFFLTELLPLQAFPSLYHSEVFSFPFAVVEFHEVSVGPFLQPVEVPRDAALSLSILIGPPDLILCAVFSISTS